MESLTIRAHFDGVQIRLDEPVQLEPGAELLITVLPAPQEDDDDREGWVRLAMIGLERAYGEDEPEYTLDMIKEPNPDYAGG